jgi:hypothetical protein
VLKAVLSKWRSVKLVYIKQYSIIIIIIIIILFHSKMFSVHNYLFFRFLSLLVFLFVCFSAIMCSCNIPLTLCCVSPLCSYVYLYCVVSVIGLVAVDSAHK